MRCFLSLTNRCNRKCDYCYYNVGVLEKSNYEPSLEDIKKSIDFLYNIKCDSISLTGGEPLTRKDIDEIIDYAYKRTLKITLVTNGIELMERLSINSLKQISCFAISLHIDQNTDINSYFILMSSLANELSKYTGRIRFNFTLTGFNYRYFKEYTKMCTDLNIDFNVQPVVLNKNISKDNVNVLGNIDKHELNYLAILILKWGKDSNNAEYSKKLVSLLKGKKIKYNQCMAGINFFVIDDRKLSPCFYRQEVNSEYLLTPNNESKNINVLDLFKSFDNKQITCQGPHCITLCEFGKYL